MIMNLTRRRKHKHTNRQRKLKIDQGLVRYTVHKAIENLFCGPCAIDIILCSAAYMRKLNKDYLDKNYATDVLSFEVKEYIGDMFYIGEIYIAPSLVQKNCLKYKDFWEKEGWIESNNFNDADFYKLTGFNMELILLIIHGILHLFGYVHDEEHILDIDSDNYDKEMKNMQRLLFGIVYRGLRNIL